MGNFLHYRHKAIIHFSGCVVNFIILSHAQKNVVDHSTQKTSEHLENWYYFRIRNRNHWTRTHSKQERRGFQHSGEEITCDAIVQWHLSHRGIRLWGSILFNSAIVFWMELEGSTSWGSSTNHFFPSPTKKISSGTWVTENISLDHLHFTWGNHLHSTVTVCSVCGIVHLHLQESWYILGIFHTWCIWKTYIYISLYMYRHLTQTHTNMAGETKLSHPFEPSNIHKHIYIICHPIIRL